MMLYRLHVVAHDVAIAVDSYTRPDAGDLDALSARCTDVLVWGSRRRHRRPTNTRSVAPAARSSPPP